MLVRSWPVAPLRSCVSAVSDGRLPVPGLPAARLPATAYPPPAYRRPPGRGGRTRMEDLEGYLTDLEGELARVREELTEYRRDGAETVSEPRRAIASASLPGSGRCGSCLRPLRVVRRLPAARLLGTPLPYSVEEPMVAGRVRAPPVSGVREATGEVGSPKQIEAPPEHAGGQGLAGVRGDRGELASAVDADDVVDVVWAVAGERGAPFGVEGRCDLGGQGPGRRAPGRSRTSAAASAAAVAATWWACRSGRGTGRTSGGGRVGVVAGGVDDGADELAAAHRGECCRLGSAAASWSRRRAPPRRRRARGHGCGAGRLRGRAAWTPPRG